MPYPSSLKCGHTMLKSCYVKFHEHLRRGHILKYIGKISLANFQLKIYLVEENWVWMLEFGMHVATNMFQKRNWAFFEILIFFGILGGSKSKLCDFLHFLPFFQVLNGHKWQKNQTIKKSSDQFFKHVMIYMYAKF